MCLKKSVMRIDVKINTDFFLKSGFELLLQSFDKLSYPAVVLIIFLAVADENVVFVSGNYTCHLSRSL